MDVGYDSGSPVTEDYPARNTFTGKIDWVDVSIGPAEPTTSSIPEELLKIAMIRQ